MSVGRVLLIVATELARREFVWALYYEYDEFLPNEQSVPAD